MPLDRTFLWQRVVVAICLSASVFAVFGQTGVGGLAGAFLAAFLALLPLLSRNRPFCKHLAIGTTHVILLILPILLWTESDVRAAIGIGFASSLLLAATTVLLRRESLWVRLLVCLGLIIGPFFTWENTRSFEPASPLVFAIATGLFVFAVLALYDSTADSAMRYRRAIGWSALPLLAAVFAGPISTITFVALVLHLTALLAGAWRQSADFRPVPAESHIDARVDPSRSYRSILTVLILSLTSSLIAYGVLRAGGFLVQQLLHEPSSSPAIAETPTTIPTAEAARTPGPAQTEPIFPAVENPISSPDRAALEAPPPPASPEDGARQSRPLIDFADRTILDQNPRAIGFLQIPEGGRARLPLYLRLYTMSALEWNGFSVNEVGAEMTSTTAARASQPFFLPERSSDDDDAWWILHLREGGGEWLPISGPFSELRLEAASRLQWSPRHFGIRRSDPSPDLTVAFNHPDFSRRVPATIETDPAIWLHLYGDPRIDASLRTMAVEIAGSDDLSPARFAQRALTHLRQQATYSFDTQIPAGPEPALYRWLIHGRDGYCEYFAGAFVLLSRAYGVPARVVTGFLLVEGPDERNRLRIDDLHAHAWAEILIGDQWERVEATPPGRRGPDRPLTLGDALTDDSLLTFDPSPSDSRQAPERENETAIAPETTDAAHHEEPSAATPMDKTPGVDRPDAPDPVKTAAESPFEHAAPERAESSDTAETADGRETNFPADSTSATAEAEDTPAAAANTEPAPPRRLPSEEPSIEDAPSADPEPSPQTNEPAEGQPPSEERAEVLSRDGETPATEPTDRALDSADHTHRDLGEPASAIPAPEDTPASPSPAENAPETGGRSPTDGTEEDFNRIRSPPVTAESRASPPRDDDTWSEDSPTANATPPAHRTPEEAAVEAHPVAQPDREKPFSLSAFLPRLLVAIALLAIFTVAVLAAKHWQRTARGLKPNGKQQSRQKAGRLLTLVERSLQAFPVAEDERAELQSLRDSLLHLRYGPSPAPDTLRELDERWNLLQHRRPTAPGFFRRWKRGKETDAPR